MAERCLSYHDARNRGVRFHEVIGPSRTKQEFKEECDINNIMARYLATSVFPADVRVGTYGDFYDAPDYQRALDILAVSREQFGALPSKVRARFENDPEKFLEFVGNPANLEEAHDMGLLSEEGAKKVAAAREARKPKVEPKKEA